ncbi:hypothetical protein EJ03DRAFT_38277 [Teratosphaeria nubilosa]|uniref:Uncharacterized protein n=1 Tax=Teratosphaeria nubilosa TaxID=161662 RepID=A0A6G1LEC2_9PEZI|nr:hypothetical protein EJ03DRAFT_38277 [Teratosphaeria nubilosa]
MQNHIFRVILLPASIRHHRSLLAFLSPDQHTQDHTSNDGKLITPAPHCAIKHPQHCIHASPPRPPHPPHPSNHISQVPTSPIVPSLSTGVAQHCPGIQAQNYPLIANKYCPRTLSSEMDSQ